MTTSTGRHTAREFWRFYRGYVETPIHALSAAALAIFGILVFVDPLFALLAIASYVVPPVVLFSIGWSTPGERRFEPDDRSVERARQFKPSAAERGAPPESGSPKQRSRSVTDGDFDSGGDDGDSDDGDTDTDSDDGDSDTDS